MTIDGEIVVVHTEQLLFNRISHLSRTDERSCLLV